MRCDNVVKKYLGLEDNSILPLMLRIHLLYCRKCHTEISRLDKTFSALKKDSPYKSSYNINSAVMTIISSGYSPAEKTISGIQWVSIGTIIFSSILLINFSESFIWLKKEFGSYFSIPISIVLGLVLTAYSTILIGCNYEYIKKYIALHSRWKLK